MVGRKPGRLLAPVALLAVIVAVVLVVHAGVGSHHHPPAAATRPPAALPVSHHAPPKHRFYVIQQGDSLSSISVKTHVPVATLESLNPSVDPSALQTGQRLRLR